MKPLNLSDLRDFTGGDIVQAQQAFSRCEKHIRRFSQAYFRNHVSDLDDSNDLVQLVVIKVWEARERFEIRSEGAWWSFVRLVADRTFADWLRMKKTSPTTVVIMDETPSDEVNDVERIVEYLTDRARLYALADDVWLGKDNDPSGMTIEERLLAAQLFHVDRCSWEEVAMILGGENPVERDRLDECLADLVVLKRLVFRELYWANDTLCGFVLNPENPLLEAELDELPARIKEGGKLPRIGAWSIEEVQIIIRRLRNGLLVDQIERFSDCAMSTDEIQGVLDRAADSFPILKAAKILLTNLGRTGQIILEDTNIWRRLVFQYHAADDLKRPLILERTEPAATYSGYSLNDGMLNVWLSNFRLMRQLAKNVGI